MGCFKLFVFGQVLCYDILADYGAELIKALLGHKSVQGHKSTTPFSKLRL